MDRLNKIIKKVIIETTSDSRGSRGSYVSPLLPGYREFDKNQIAPFTEYVTDWDDASLDHDSLDGKMSTDPKTIRRKEKRAEKISKFMKNNPDKFAWSDDAGIINSLPFHNTDAKPIKNYDPKKTTVSLDGVVRQITKKIKESINDYNVSYPSLDQNKSKFLEKVPFNEWIDISDKGIINEDLAVWFGKKKKPKGSSQPKGPWVDICRKVDGKHPPCGRQDTSKGSYPKCRAAGVASKMSDSQKRSACQQKRAAENKDTQTGKGQKPIMTSYKPKKK